MSDHETKKQMGDIITMHLQGISSGERISSRNPALQNPVFKDPASYNTLTLRNRAERLDMNNTKSNYWRRFSTNFIHPLNLAFITVSSPHFTILQFHKMSPTNTEFVCWSWTLYLHPQTIPASETRLSNKIMWPAYVTLAELEKSHKFHAVILEAFHLFETKTPCKKWTWNNY